VHLTPDNAEDPSLSLIPLVSLWSALLETLI